MWMSVNQFKKRFGYIEAVPFYEPFFVMSGPEGELVLDMKKRYIRIVIQPEDAVILLSKKDAALLAKAASEKIEGPIEKMPRSVWKDKHGIKVYADFRDGQNVRVVMREADSRHVFIEAPRIPHLRVQDAKELVRALQLFSKGK